MRERAPSTDDLGKALRAIDALPDCPSHSRRQALGDAAHAAARLQNQVLAPDPR